METIKFSAENNEFDTNECVICMDVFNEGELINRVPICRHFFHMNCIRKWFEG